MSAKGGLVIAGGGTGGHVLAGIAVADEWKSRAGAGDIAFVGAYGGIEEKLVPRAGYPLTCLNIGALKGKGLGRRLKTLFQLPIAIASSAAWLLSRRPRAVLGVGGYASGPLVLAARVLGPFTGTRTAILEQNSVPGFTNRMLGRLVQRVFCTFPGTEARFPAGRARVTGNPVRSAMHRLASAPREPFTVFIFGGSQGAAGINQLVTDALPLLKDLKLRFIHQTGEKDFDRTLAAHRAAGTDARVEKFIHDMPACYERASLVICRSGSSTLSELAAVGRASVLVPFPFASDNHQEVNARVFTDAGAALLLKQQDSTGADLARIIREAMADPARLARMEEAVTAFHRPQAASEIVGWLGDGLVPG
jgi:UDP-N-acetylglucosamine--N-acetylmuramyl-(pentapeptide) pyrophosphoryl-undecaprenol N-acetylglucosamine transferase